MSPAPGPASPGRARPRRGARRSTRPDLVRGDPAERLARFLARVERLTPDELDRLAAAEPPPIAFLATVRRFLSPDARASFAAAEAELVRRVPPERWAEVGLREGLLGVTAELVLAPFLDDLLAEPFRGRARERLLRAWDASLDQPRHGPNGDDVAALRERASRLTRTELAAFLRASQGIAGDDRPWPESLDRDVDEALRISALLAARDVAAAVPVGGLAPAVATRARRLAARTGHVTALRHAFPPAIFAALVAPWTRQRPPGRSGAPGAVGPTAPLRAARAPRPARGRPRLCDPRAHGRAALDRGRGAALALGAALLVMRRRADELDRLADPSVATGNPPRPRRTGARPAVGTPRPPRSPTPPRRAGSRAHGAPRGRPPPGRVVHVGTDHRITAANPRAATLLGSGTATLVGRSVMEVFLDARWRRRWTRFRSAAA